MEELRFLKNLKNVKEYDESALEGNLICECGNDFFNIRHTGKQKKGIFSSYIVKLNGQLGIKARCTKCGKEFKIYDSSQDGEDFKKKDLLEYQDFFIDKYMKKDYKVRLAFNYMPQNFKTNKFVSIYVYLNNDELKKEIALFEN